MGSRGGRGLAGRRRSKPIPALKGRMSGSDAVGWSKRRVWFEERHRWRDEHWDILSARHPSVDDVLPFLHHVPALHLVFGFVVDPARIERPRERDISRPSRAPEALYVVIDPLTNTHRGRINTLALAERLPTMHAIREGVEAGGLMSYGPNIPALYQRAAEFVDKVL